MADGPALNPTLKAACDLIPGTTFDEDSQTCLLPAGGTSRVPAKLPGSHTVISDAELEALRVQCESYKTQRIALGVGGLVVGGLVGYMFAR